MVETFTVTVYHAELAAIASEFGEDFFHDRLRTPKVNAIQFLFENGFYARKARVTVKFTNAGYSSTFRILNKAYECTNAVEYDWAENEEVEMFARPGNRSSASGDIFLMDHTREYFLCMDYGWEKISLK